MRIFDYCFYHLIHVNLGDQTPPLLAYISGILVAGLPLWLNIIMLSALFPVLPEDIDFETRWRYYYLLAGIIFVIFAFRYGPKRYIKLKKKWENEPHPLRSKILVIIYILGSIILNVFITYNRW